MAAQTNFFQDEANPKFEEIKKALEGDSIAKKLENMKRLIAMISKGRDVKALFPNVVKNVICDNIQVKRLVYMYLIHYAEFEQDLALLSINTFQKDLDNPSPLIRAQALRVLSSIRLRVITHILIISVKRCVVDNSPYVRKTAAHAIPKIYNLDHEKKEELVECVEILLGDNTTLVLGSAVAAFSEICPERIDLLHPHFRKLCNVIADVDEWGQTLMVNVLARYARTQFANPNPHEKTNSFGKPKKKKKVSNSFYSDEDSEEEELSDYDDGEVDPDHRLLLRAVTPLLQSRNNGVVVAVSMLFYYCAPSAEALKIGKPLVRIVRSPYQISYLILKNILSIAKSKPEIFTPYLTEFFSYDSDPRYIRELKLQILTEIATETNIGTILKEYLHYVKSEDKDFVKATIQAIGVSATRLPDVQETCLQRLISLLSNSSEVVVAESVVVIKKLLQLDVDGDQTKVILHLAKLLEKLDEPNARASIIWIVGEYNKQISEYAPDILRKLSLSFKNEKKVVKLQVLNLGAKLLLANPSDEKINLMFQYISNMCRFDMNYDLRDRARIFKAILLGKSTPLLKQNSLQLICSDKPAPETVSSNDADNFALNSLSHIVSHTAFGYHPISEWPEEIPDPSVRNQVARKQRTAFGLPGVNVTPTGTTVDVGSGGFYSDEESSEYTDFTDSEESFESDGDAADSFFGSSTKKRGDAQDANFFGSSTPAKSSADDFFGGDDDDDFSEDEPANDFFGSPSTPAPQQKDLLSTDLLGISFDSPSQTTTPTPTMTPSLNLMTPSPSPSSANVTRKSRILLKQVVSQGLQVEYLFLRRASIQGPGFSPIQLQFINNSDHAFSNLVVKGSNNNVVQSEAVNFIPANSQAESLLNVKFTSPTMPVKLTVTHQDGNYPVELQPPPGELISQSGAISAGEFATTQKKLGGMQEVSGKFPIDPNDIAPKVVSVANVAVLSENSDVYQFAGKTIMDDQNVLISVEVREGFARLKVNCGNAIFGTTLHRELKKILERKA